MWKKLCGINHFALFQNVNLKTASVGCTDLLWLNLFFLKAGWPFQFCIKHDFLTRAQYNAFPFFLVGKILGADSWFSKTGYEQGVCPAKCNVPELHNSASSNRRRLRKKHLKDDLMTERDRKNVVSSHFFFSGDIRNVPTNACLFFSNGTRMWPVTLNVSTSANSLHKVHMVDAEIS